MSSQGELGGPVTQQAGALPSPGAAPVGSGVTSISVNGGALLTGAVALTIVTSAIAGVGIGVSAASGAVTFTNTGVTSIVAGTGVTISGPTGAVTVNATAAGAINGADQVLFANAAGTLYTTETPTATNFFQYANAATTATLGITKSVLARFSAHYSDTTGAAGLVLNGDLVGGAQFAIVSYGPTALSTTLGFNNAGNIFLVGNVNTSGAPNMYIGLSSGAGSVLTVVGVGASIITQATVNSNFIVGTGADVASVKFSVDPTKTVAAAAGAIWDGVLTTAAVLTLSGATTTTTEVKEIHFTHPTITSASAQTITTASTVKIGGAPVATAAGGATPTITNKWALWVAETVAADSPVRIDSRLRLGGGIAPSDIATNPVNALELGVQLPVFNGGGTCISIGSSAASQFSGLQIGQDATHNGLVYWQYNASAGSGTFNVGTVGVNNQLYLTGSIVNLQNSGGTGPGQINAWGWVTVVPTRTVASAGAGAWNGFIVNAATLTLTGSVTTNEIAFTRIQQPTITDASAVTVTDAASFIIDGQTIAGGSVTITNNYAFLLKSGRTKLIPTRSVVAAAGAVWNGFNVGAATITLTGATTPVTELATSRFEVGTITAASAVATTTAATVVIDGAPAAAGSATIGTSLQIYAKAGLNRYRGATANASEDICQIYSPAQGGGTFNADQKWILWGVDGVSGCTSRIGVVGAWGEAGDLQNYQLNYRSLSHTFLNVAGDTAWLSLTGTAFLVAAGIKIGFFGAVPVVQPTVGANVNNVVASGTTGQFDDFTNGTVYATDYANLHATVSQLCRTATQLTVAVRALGAGA